MFLWNLGQPRVTHWPKPGPHLWLCLSLFRSVSMLTHFSCLYSDFTQWQRWAAAPGCLFLQSLHCLLHQPSQEKSAGLQFNKKPLKERQCGVLKDSEKGLKDLNFGSASIRNQLGNDQMSLPITHDTKILQFQFPVPNWLPDTFHFQHLLCLLSFPKTEMFKMFALDLIPCTCKT